MEKRYLFVKSMLLLTGCLQRLNIARVVVLLARSICTRKRSKISISTWINRGFICLMIDRGWFHFTLRSWLWYC